MSRRLWFYDCPSGRCLRFLRLVMNDRCLKINWVACKLTLMNGVKRCIADIPKKVTFQPCRRKNHLVDKPPTTNPFGALPLASRPRVPTSLELAPALNLRRYCVRHVRKGLLPSIYSPHNPPKPTPKITLRIKRIHHLKALVQALSPARPAGVHVFPRGCNFCPIVPGK
jgi:hypothetical protein